MGASHFFPFSTRFCRRFLELYIASSAVSKVVLARRSSAGLGLSMYVEFLRPIRFWITIL
jgi:hypothetical protein